MNERDVQLPVTKLLPAPVESVPLEGLYLRDELDLRSRPGRAYVYTNFVTSLDGRISIGPDDGRPHGVPEALANDRDWRLYQELAFQADAVITSGRYVRDFAAGTARSLFSPARNQNLSAWRVERGLTAFPAIAVVSRELDFDVDAARGLSRSVIAIGAAGAPASRIAELERQGVPSIIGAATTGVAGREIAEGLAGLGHKTAYSSAGPQLAHLLIADGVLDRLYVTTVTRLLGGRAYATLDEGPLHRVPATAQVAAMYFDAVGPDGASQVFTAYRLVPDAPHGR